MAPCVERRETIFRGLPVTSRSDSGRQPERGARRPFTVLARPDLRLRRRALFTNEAVIVSVAVVYGLVTPWGLSIRGRTGPLVWTRRVTTLAVVATIIALAIALIGLVVPRPWYPAAVVVWAVPVILDVTTRAY